MIYKVNLTLESKMTEVPNAAKLFGYIFGKILKNKKMKSNAEINQYLNDIAKSTFNISDLMPKGYVYNPTASYDDKGDEEFTSEKSTVKKKIKKYTYVDYSYLCKVFDSSTHKLCPLEMESKFYKKYQVVINQHVQINTLTKENENNPQPFNIHSINTNDTEFEFYIEFDEVFKPDLDNVLQPQKDQLVILGAHSGKGYNMFILSTDAVTQCVRNEVNANIVLSNYIPRTSDEFSATNQYNDFKIKNGSARPVRMPHIKSNDTRFRYFYIEPGAIINFENTNNLGNLVSYYPHDDSGYDPKIFGKPFVFPIGGLNECK